MTTQAMRSITGNTASSATHLQINYLSYHIIYYTTQILSTFPIPPISERISTLEVKE